MTTLPTQPAVSTEAAGDTGTRPLRGLFVGLTTLDVVHRAVRPERNTKVTATRQDLAAGGPAANAAVTFAALGGQATLVSALGDGVAARAARADLEAHGVTVVDAAPAGFELAVSAVLVDDATGDRSVVSPDAGRLVVPAPEPPVLARWVADADVVLLDGHHPALALAVLDGVGQRRGAHSGEGPRTPTNLLPVVLDAGRWKPWLDDILPRCSAVAASADFRVGGTDAPSGPALRAIGVAQVAVTHGPHDVEWWQDARHGRVEVPRVRAVDTLAAGDVFHGALAYALASGTSFVDALTLAARVAARRVQVVGPRAWVAGLAGVLDEAPRP